MSVKKLKKKIGARLLESAASSSPEVRILDEVFDLFEKRFSQSFLSKLRVGKTVSSGKSHTLKIWTNNGEFLTKQYEVFIADLKKKYSKVVVNSESSECEIQLVGKDIKIIAKDFVMNFSITER